MLLKIALNGARPKAENENIPKSLGEIENDVRRIYQAGYSVFHIHCYDKSGNESLKPEDINNLTLRIRNISAKIKFGISSGDWIEPDLDKRIGYIREWKYVPDFASVNMIEDDSLLVSNELIKKGVMVEAGLNEKKAAEIFIKSNLSEGCCRILIEPEEENSDDALSTITQIENILDLNKVPQKRLLHGFNKVSWNLLRLAKMKGYDARIGLEDTIFLENGEKVIGNLELIKEAERIFSSF